jgi:DnaK suppressor protein
MSTSKSKGKPGASNKGGASRARAKAAAPAKSAAHAKVLAKAPAKAPEKPQESVRAKSVVKAAGKPTGSTKKEKVAVAAEAPPKSIEDIKLDPDYRPSENEPFMNGKQRAYFRAKLLKWKEDINRQTRETLEGLHEDSTQHADLADRATSETDRALELRARDRQRKLVAKIDAALARIEDGTYGYCEETGEPIGLKRLDARPIATLSLEAQERHERREKVYRED